MMHAPRFDRAHRAAGAPLRRLSSRLGRLIRAREGTFAVETALALPTMVAFYLGATELANLVNTKHKMEMVSRVVADLAGRATTMNVADARGVLAAAKAVMAPFTGTGLKVVVSSVTVTATKNANGEVVSATGAVDWSCANDGGGLAKKTPIDVPAAYRTAQSFIWATVDMPYTPLFGSSVIQMVTGQASAKLAEAVAWPVRDVDQVLWSGGACS